MRSVSGCGSLLRAQYIRENSSSVGKPGMSSATTTECVCVCVCDVSSYTLSPAKARWQCLYGQIHACIKNTRDNKLPNTPTNWPRPLTREFTESDLPRGEHDQVTEVNQRVTDGTHLPVQHGYHSRLCVCVCVFIWGIIYTYTAICLAVIWLRWIKARI